MIELIASTISGRMDQEINLNEAISEQTFIALFRPRTSMGLGLKGGYDQIQRSLAFALFVTA